MALRFGFGPVFVYESLLNARRWQVYAGRSFFVVVLLVGMTIAWLAHSSPLFTIGRPVTTLQQMAQLGQAFFYALAGIQVSLVMLAAPAATAGAICMDRASGTLLHMLVTDLSDVEIVLGKLAARLAPVFAMIACGVPVTALAALLGGIDFGALAGALVVSLSLAVFGCALALTISVWAQKTHEVLMAVYVALGLGLLTLPIWWGVSSTTKVMPPPAWFQKGNPYVIVFAPYNKPGFVSATDYALFAFVFLGLSAALLGLSIAKLRRVVVAQSGQAEKAGRRWPEWISQVLPSLSGPSLDGNPVLWREWHRNRPSRLARWLWYALQFVTWTLAAWGTYELVTMGAGREVMGLKVGFTLQLTFGLLILSATAPTALAEERVRGSLDVLLATPVSTRSIVVGMWWGAYRMVLILMLLPLFVAVLLAGATPDLPSFAGAAGRFYNTAVPLTSYDRLLSVTLCIADFLASSAIIVSLGVAMATWIRRLGRAVALSVIAYFLTGIGWIFLCEVLLSSVVRQYAWMQENQRLFITIAVSLSPIGGPINPISKLEQFVFGSRWTEWIGEGVVLIIKVAVAWLLFLLTVKTFDRCVGRVPESSTCDRGRQSPWALSSSGRPDV